MNRTTAVSSESDVQDDVPAYSLICLAPRAARTRPWWTNGGDWRPPSEKRRGKKETSVSHST